SLYFPDPLVLGPYSRPPGVCLRVHPRAPPRPLLPPLRLLPAAPRSPLTQSELRESSPGSHSGPKTRSSRPPATSPCPPFDKPRLRLADGPSGILHFLISRL